MGLLDLLSGGGQTGSSGGGLGDFMRNRVQSWQAHPFQNIASSLLGAFVPGGGLASSAAFNRYNDNQFNNSANQFRDLSQQQSNMDTNSAMNAPLNGPLGAYDRAHPFGEGGGMQAGGSVSGSGGAQSAGGYTGSTQGPGNFNFGYGSQWGSGNAPRQPSSFVNDILDSISTGPGQPGTQQGGLFENGPEARRDGSWGGAMNPGANYGISPMMANGQQMITGYDPNQMVMANGRRNMY